MNDDVVRLAVVGRLVRRRWRLLAALAAAGAVVGLGLSFLISPGYTATSTVLLQGAGDKQQILTETQIATSLVVLDRAAAELGWGDVGADLKDAVTAVVSDGNVIRISGVASTTERALQLTDRATAEYVGFSAQLGADAANAVAAVTAERERAVQDRVDELTAEVDELERSPLRQAQSPEGAQVRAQIDQLRNALVSANGELDELERGPQPTDDNAIDLGIIVLERAIPTGAAPPSLPQLVAGGALLFGILGVTGLLAAARSDRRLRDPDRIAAALGAPVLAAVDVAVPAAVRPTGSGGSRVQWLRDLLREEAEWTGQPAAASRPAEDIRYRRVLSRLRGAGDGHRSILVLLPDDDAAAVRAVAELVAVAASEGTPVELYTSSDELAERAGEVARQAGSSPLPVTVNRSDPGADRPAHRTEIRAVPVATDRPEIPDAGSVAATLVVTSVGTRTSWELVAVARAASDGGYPVTGALVVRSGPAVEDDVPDPAPESGSGSGPEPEAGPAATNGTMMADSA